MIEQKLSDLTAAIDRLTAALTASNTGAATAPAPSTPERQEQAAEPQDKPKRGRGRPRKTETETAEADEAAESAEADDEAAESGDAGDLPAAVTDEAAAPVDVGAVRRELMGIVQRAGAGPVKALIAEYATELVKVSAEDLPKLLARAKKLDSAK